MGRCVRVLLGPLPATVLLLPLLLSGLPVAAAAQTEGCEPVAQRAGRWLGCFITARETLGALPRDSALYWHIDGYARRAAAAAAKGPRSTVIESLGRVWLFTIAEARWRPAGGEHLVAIGPLPLVDAKTYAAVYMGGCWMMSTT